MSPSARACDWLAYAVRAGEHYLLYAPASDLVAMVNAAAMRAVRTCLVSGAASDWLPDSLQAILRAVGASQLRDPARKRGALAPAFLGIIPSRRCNMACRYCSFREQGSGRVMEPAIAAHAIDFMAGTCVARGWEKYEIQLFGGEPFVEDSVVDVVVHHALSATARFGVTPTFSASTNGVMTASRLRFIADYFDRVVLSLDGFEDFQECYRPTSQVGESFARVSEAARFLRHSQAQLCIRCCVTSVSVHHMESIARWFCEEFHPAQVNFEAMTESPDSRAAGLKPPAPYDFARHALRAWRILRSFGCEPACAPVLNRGLQNTSCPVGRDTVIVHPDGLLASCYLVPSEWDARGMDLSIGRVLADGQVEVRARDVLRLRRLIHSKPRCSRCFCRLSCAGGCHVNNSYPGCPDQYGDFCQSTRILTACGLLEEIGESERADELVCDRDALERLSAPRSDRVIDFEDAG